MELNKRLLALSDENEKRPLDERVARSIRQITILRAETGDKDEKDKACEELVGDHYKFILNRANVLASNSEILRNEVHDMIQQGIMGLLKAAKSYDITSGYAFYTYADSFIRGAMNEYFNSFSNTKQHYATLIVKLNRGIRILEEQGITNPTITQLSNVTGLKPEQIQRAMAAQRARLTRSLDYEDGSENDEHLDRAAYDGDNNPESKFIRSEKSQVIDEALKALPEKECEAMSRFYGYKCDQQKYAEIAVTMKMSVKEVKTLIAKARRRLREDENMRNMFYDHNNYIHSQVEQTDMGTW